MSVMAAAVAPPSCGDVAARLEAVEADLASLAHELVPERVPAVLLGRVVRSLGRIERRAGGARLVLTQAAADVGTWKAEGFRSPEAWAARAHGTSTAAARADLEASARLAGLAAARDAAGSGELSTEAAKAVAAGASADPAAEADLLGSARAGDLGEVRDKARRARQRVDERDGRAAQRMFRRRGLRTWLELDGEGRGSWNVPPEYQARFLAALEPYRQEAFRLARESGRRETPEALMADALDLLARDTLADQHLPDPTEGTTSGAPDDGDDERSGRVPGPSEADAREDAGDPIPAAATDDTSDRKGTPGDDEPRGGSEGGAVPRPAQPPGHRATERPRGAGNRRPPAQVVVHVSYDALIRGHAADGERCEVPGLGPVPVAFARFLANDCLLRLVLTGTDVTVITSQRRYVPADLRAALDARDPECVVPGCHARHHLERDHWGTDFAKAGPTELANLCRICPFHHHLKTHCGWTLTGGPGHWAFRPP